MTTPFAALAVMTKSAHAYPVESQQVSSVVLHPFAMIDPFVKEAGFFSGIKDSIWNNTMKPVGDAIGQAGQGLGQMAAGASESFGNAIKTPFRAARGALTGGVNAFKQQLTQPGDVNLGAIGQGMMDGGWNAGKQSLGYAANGVMKNLQGAGDVAGGAAKAAWGMHPAVFAGRYAMGAGQGVMNGVQNFANDLKQRMMPQGGGTPGAAPAGMQMIPPGQPGSIMQGPPAPTPDAIAPSTGGGNIMMGGGASNSAMGAGYGQGFNPGAAPDMSGGFNPGVPPNMGAATPRPVSGAPSSVGNAPSYQGPTADDYRRTMGSYNPSSPFDQRKAEAINQIWQQNGGRVSPNQVYANPLYSGISKSGSAHEVVVDQILTPFAIYELNPEASMSKEAMAGGIAGWLRSALQRGATSLNRGSRLAKATAGRTARAEAGAAQKAQAGATSVAGDLPALPTGREAFNKAYAGAGNARQGIADFMGNAGLRIDASPGLQKVINYGVPTAAAGGIFYGGNRMGQNTGMQEGLSRGFDTGADYGIQASLANMPQDPGFFGRIADVFTGQQRGPQAYDIQALLDANKSQILQQLRSA